MQSSEFDFFQYFYIYAPSMILVLGAIVVLLSNAFARHFSRSNSIALCSIFIAFALLFTFSLAHSTSIPRIIYIGEILILLSGLCFIFLSFSRYRFVGLQTQEFYPLYLFSLSGFLIMICADNFIVMLLGLEIGSLPLCALMAFSRRLFGIEAGIKYFVSSALASMFLLVGIMLLYLYSGSFDLDFPMQVFAYSSHFDSISANIIAMSGAMFILAGVGFKVSLVPWHSWMPDIYEGSSPMLAGFISVVPKIAGFIVFYAIFSPIFSVDSNNSYFDKLFKILLMISITLPNIAALLQKDVKRMLAFSSISHSGFALACIYLNNFDTLIIYWVLFFITNLGAFALLWCLMPRELNSRFDYSFDRFYGLAKARPIVALALAFFMIALAGIPPFSIFWGKIFVITAALSSNEIALAFVMMLNSAIAVCYYLKLPVAMYFKTPKPNTQEYIDNSTILIRVIIVICTFLVLTSAFLVPHLFDIV
ncbi:NADH-quinone oxidoreductase subunit NuoN [Helicobacter saguini]|uniref:NADH-quinone oxidoreductase subunit N n=1 Tax=Helicobacter saguini TaxID=1548018 RepID=A0A347VSC6_9HELI|nr:NADH-quinone oxidoreductase subunit N [Helicobacter saguini]MWV62560.1 NADH-quinone oxidoreductase subunit NuoN [Helicobacter saguini]MWV66766.1 NADH-quinone oxidoreductase subunit NuoN [Helicobacter saguini]MWV69117.1 NADH-quinone oxidoreductase subunit NuoN [Helicobacter saguini]MWV71328.1 NADH-quinone oxidoreductase subunit NuoN [Helicobacter saguini]TLD94162.1 NADH-quinone oxidoreductase subunit N [Helicobacter saguini]